MRAIHRKLWRDLWELRGQALAIGLVIASGVATYVMSRSTLDSLRATQARFYAESRFTDVFASLKRAPETLLERVTAIPGVALAESRVAGGLKVDLPDYADPIEGHVVSVPDDGEARLDRLTLRAGVFPSADRDDEILVSEGFAEAHDLRPGDSLHATMNGNRRFLRIVGVALSPEYLYQIRPGAMIPDFEHYGIFWMARTPLAAAFDMEAAFNDVAVAIERGASSGDVIERLDLLLEPYGGLGAIDRDDQLSHRYLREEFRQLESMATIFPTIFLGVAAFLLNVVLSRLVQTQREQIAALKAFGYSNAAVGVHYAQMVGLIVIFGALGGLAIGAWLGHGLSVLYSGFYRFPYLDFVLEPDALLTGVIVSALAALGGTLHAVRRASRLPPAEAMRPEPPAKYRASVVERLGLRRLLSQPDRMIIRHLERRPLKSVLSVLGIGMATAILMIGHFQGDAIDFLVRVQFGLAEREDLTVTFVEPTSRGALHELGSIEGVEHVEPFRAVEARLSHENRAYRTGITGFTSGGDLHRVLDTGLRPVLLPPAGIVISDHLATILGVGSGDEIRVEVLEGTRPVHTVRVSSIVQQYIGVGAYMELDALQRLLRDGDAISGAYLATDSSYDESIWRELEEMPRVAGSLAQKSAVDSFYETMAETMLVFTFVNTLLAATIACGVVYNSARIALSERSRELASLRVLGMTKGEISYILLGELGVLTVLGLPVGFAAGTLLCYYMVTSMANDLYRIPVVLEPSTFAFAATTILIAACASAFVVGRHLDRLDLVAVLKTKE